MNRPPPDRIEVVAHDPAWTARFADLGRDLRAGLGDVALRIDHIGSTSVPGLAAKPIIDIQISVAAFEPLEAFKHPLERLGYMYRADNPERTKRYFREPPGRPRTHVHVRRAGSFSEQWALLFRDYLRAHAEVAAEYAALKRRLAARLRDDRRAYLDAKGRFYGKSCAWPTGGRKPRDGIPAPATPDPRAVQRLRKRMRGGSGDDVADPLGRAWLRIQGGGPLGQLPELAAQLLERAPGRRTRTRVVPGPPRQRRGNPRRYAPVGS